MSSKKIIPPKYSDRLRLRLLEEKDLPLTLSWRNQDSIRKWFFHSDLISIEQHLSWFAKYQIRDDDYVFIIELSALEHWIPVGQIALYNIDWMNRKAEYGRLMIGDPYAKGKGIAREATNIILELGFSSLGLSEIYLEVLENNAPARKVYEDCGFLVRSIENNVVRMEISESKSKLNQIKSNMGGK